MQQAVLGLHRRPLCSCSSSMVVPGCSCFSWESVMPWEATHLQLCPNGQTPRAIMCPQIFTDSGVPPFPRRMPCLGTTKAGAGPEYRPGTPLPGVRPTPGIGNGCITCPLAGSRAAHNHHQWLSRNYWQRPGQVALASRSLAAKHYLGCRAWHRSPSLAGG